MFVWICLLSNLFFTSTERPRKGTKRILGLVLLVKIKEKIYVNMCSQTLNLPLTAIINHTNDPLKLTNLLCEFEFGQILSFRYFPLLVIC